MSKDNVVVGFVGLGTMGGRMAANVQKAGFKLVVHDLLYLWGGCRRGRYPVPYPVGVDGDRRWCLVAHEDRLQRV